MRPIIPAKRPATWKSHATANGIIVGLRGEVTIDIGAYARGTGGTSPTRCAQFLPGPYRIPNFACKVNAYVSNKTPSGTYRGPGRVEANFFRERLIDIAAADLGIDPADIRRRNFVTAQEMPFNIGRLVTYEEPHNSIPAISAPSSSAHSRRSAGAKSGPCKVATIDGWYHGIGFASFVESGAGGVKEQARIRLDAGWDAGSLCRCDELGTRPRDGVRAGVRRRAASPA